LQLSEDGFFRLGLLALGLEQILVLLELILESVVPGLDSPQLLLVALDFDLAGGAHLALELDFIPEVVDLRIVAGEVGKLLFKITDNAFETSVRCARAATRSGRREGAGIWIGEKWVVN
jgi:hypothetical protein